MKKRTPQPNARLRGTSQPDTFGIVLDPTDPRADKVVEPCHPYWQRVVSAARENDRVLIGAGLPHTDRGTFVFVDRSMPEGIAHAIDITNARTAGLGWKKTVWCLVCPPEMERAANDALFAAGAEVAK